MSKEVPPTAASVVVNGVNGSAGGEPPAAPEASADAEEKNTETSAKAEDEGELSVVEGDEMVEAEKGGAENGQKEGCEAEKDVEVRANSSLHSIFSH